MTETPSSSANTMYALRGVFVFAEDEGTAFCKKSVVRFEAVASSFRKRASTGTEHVMFESRSPRQDKPPLGGFCIEQRVKQQFGELLRGIRKAFESDYELAK